jgi:hypothetical protein
MTDICTKCGGKGTWETSLDELDDESKEVLGISAILESWPGAKIGPVIHNCTDCRTTGKESVRLQWLTDKVDPSKHDYTYHCTDGDPCLFCEKSKEEHSG